MSAQTADNPAIVDWALASVRGASVVAHGTEARAGQSRRPETVKAGARSYATIGCVNCHGGPPDANWAKWSEGLKPVPADLKVMAKERTASQLFWAIKNGIKFTGMPSFGLAGASDEQIWSDGGLHQEAADHVGRRIQGLDGVPLDGPPLLIRAAPRDAGMSGASAGGIG